MSINRRGFIATLLGGVAAVLGLSKPAAAKSKCWCSNPELTQTFCCHCETPGPYGDAIELNGGEVYRVPADELREEGFGKALFSDDPIVITGSIDISAEKKSIWWIEHKEPTWMLTGDGWVRTKGTP